VITSEIAKYIDHTLLTPYATATDIRALCQQAKEHRFAAVCVPPYRVGLAASCLRDCPQVAVCTVIGFPLGFSPTAVKVLEARIAVEQGAAEIDMVMNVGAFKEGSFSYVSREVDEVVKAVHGRVVKVIIETGLLTREEIADASRLLMKTGANFIKTCTGYTEKGATVEDIKLIREIVGDRLRIKASSKIRDYKTALSMISAGADRLGTVQTMKILREEAEALAARARAVETPAAEPSVAERGLRR